LKDLFSKKKIDEWALDYWLLQRYAIFCYNIYYRKVEVINRHNIPRDYPVILAPNHQNALMDALAIVCNMPYQCVFLARADIFKGKRLIRLLTFMNIMPVYRIRDGIEKVKMNDAVFGKTVDVLHNKLNPLCLFAEGNHGDKRRLRPLVKGLFRIAFQAQEKYGNNPVVKIVPIGYDYGHYQKSHHWYSREIRIVRNEPDIHSWESAQSFRRIPAFDGLDYRQQENTFKLKVIALDAYIYHYGWVRPPQLMVSKTKSLDTIHKGASEVERLERENYFAFDYGPLNLLAEFTETHPAVMAGWIARFNWKEQLQFSGKPGKNRRPHVHEQFRYRLMGWIKRNIPGAETLGEFRNYILLKR